MLVAGEHQTQERRGWQTATPKSNHKEKAANDNSSRRGRDERREGLDGEAAEAMGLETFWVLP